MSLPDPDFDQVVHQVTMGWVLRRIVDRDPTVQVKTFDHGTQTAIEWRVAARIPTAEFNRLVTTYNLLR